MKTLYSNTSQILCLSKCLYLQCFLFQLKQTSTNYSPEDLIANQKFRSDLFHGVLSLVAFTSHVPRQCCLVEMHENCLAKAREDFDRISVRHVFGSIEGRYDRLRFPDHFDRNKRLVQYLDTFTNRFMVSDCIQYILY